MTTASAPAPIPIDSSPVRSSPVPRPRLWPAIVLVAVFWCVVGFMKFVTIKTLFPEDVFTQLQHFLVAFYSPMLLALGTLIWWLGFSRFPWIERLSGLALLIVGGILARLAADKSMAFGLLMTGIPVAITAVVAAMVVARVSGLQRILTIAVASFLAWGYFTLIRLDGITGQLKGQQSWRWTETAEARFLKERKQSASTSEIADPSPLTAHDSPLTASPTDWTGFRGPNRDAHVHDVSLTADWTASPPKPLWRRRVGPGWSSFAVVGNRAFTQEQRGQSEAVVCIDLATGNEIWSHEDKSRFEETVSGAGPRATPTFDSGKIYSLGGNGILNCLDAATGKLIWSHDVTTDAKARPIDENIKPPGWGFSSSPLVTGGTVVVFAGGGKADKGVLAYDAATGDLRWSAGKGVHSYSSPQLLKIGDQEQILMVSDHGLEAFDPADGKLAWEHDWYLKDMFRVVQPHIAGDGQVLISTPLNYGTRLLEIAKDRDHWTVTEKWTSKDLKPYFNDCVQLGDHLYGFDNDILVCIDLATGKKKWKKGRYGNGQALLIGDQGQLLVISEEGDAVLAEVSPQGLDERGRFKALTGKTWNHPVIAAGKLLVRNSEEMACYDLASAPDSTL
jgi:outer membrane protein assembly factor BamB